MTEKEIIKSLSALQSVNADANWVKKNREILSYQIFNGSEYADTQLGFFARLSLISKRVLQPTPIAALIALFFMASGVFGIRASRTAEPGEPLYVAKILSEKLQSTATFDEKGKALLNLEFASQRASELEKVAAGNAGDPRIQELSSSFKQEIDSARARFERIKTTATKQAAADAATKQKVSPKPTSQEAEEVFSAGAGKDNKGIQISNPDTEQALSEAEKLFNEKKYTDAVSKLNEIGKQLK
jgi:vacuolar-type H+-ATPase subunit H